MKVFNKNCLINKKILVTGASSGIGAKSVLEFNSYGAEVILVGRNKNRLDEITSKLSNKSKYRNIVTDLSIPDSGYECIKNIPKDNLPLDGIFHCAGEELIKPIALTKNEDLDSILATTIKASLSLCRAITKKSIFNNGGSVVFMSSVASVKGIPGMSAYAASKSAINGLSKSLALEFAARRIRFNSIIAGAVKTSMHERLIQNLTPQSTIDYEFKHPLGFGEAIDVANLVTFLMSDASRWITGSEIHIDGGYTAK
tara:strand:- start:5401 stop:6168 length:768 start_codon:yes stop_codon:yes gene_type:complete